VSELERRSVQRIIDTAEQLGVPIPPSVGSIVCHGRVSAGGLGYMRAHPDVDEYDPELTSCCWEAVDGGLTACSCWEPVYSVDQADPQPCDIPRNEIPARVTMCGDCAFRPGSPERSTEWHREELFALADRGEPFFCHDGMRRPLAWRHPTLGEIPGDPDDWQPPIIDGVPYRAPGEPALMCAGWAARRKTVSA
jgi:hypothetical protein